MTITMILSALLMLAVAAACFLLSALAAERGKRRAAETTLQAWQDAAHARVLLPDIEITPCAESGWEGWAEVKVGDHSDCVRVVLRFEEGDPTQYGTKVLQALSQAAHSVTHA